MWLQVCIFKRQTSGLSKICLMLSFCSILMLSKTYSSVYSMYPEVRVWGRVILNLHTSHSYAQYYFFLFVYTIFKKELSPFGKKMVRAAFHYAFREHCIKINIAEVLPSSGTGCKGKTCFSS